MKWTQAIGGIVTGVALFVSCALCGCGGSTEEVRQTNKSLTLNVDENIYDTYKDGFEEFEKTYPDVELKVDVYKDVIAGLAQVNTQLMAGEGPDLILMTNYSTADVCKMMKAQVFAPLDEWIGNDSGWDAGNYSKAVLDAGIYEGKRMVMPLSYRVQVALTSQENLEAAGISLDGCNDMASFLQEAAKFYELDSADRVISDVGQLVSFPAFMADQFLDYSKGTLGVDDQTLQTACAAYKNFYYDDAASGGSSMTDTGYWGVGEAIANGETCMAVSVEGNGFMAVSQAIAANAAPVLWPFKNGNGEICAGVMDYAGIRANSENRENAWNMLKILMGEAAQSQVAEKGQYCPVLKSVLEAGIDQAKEEAYGTGKTVVEMAELPQDLLQQYKDALMEPDKAVFVTDICTMKFLEHMKPFYEDEGSFEECLEEFKKFIKIYLTE